LTRGVTPQARAESIADPGAPARADGADLRRPPVSGRGLAPWQLFTLAALVAAVAAVALSRRTDPAHLALLSAAVLAAGLAAAAFHRMIAPLASPRDEARPAPVVGRTRAALEREKTLVLRSIKELEFDRAMGKLCEADFLEMAGRLRARALALMRQLEQGDEIYCEMVERELAARLGRPPQVAGAPGSPAPSVTASSAAPARERSCAACGAPADRDARFCKRCGTRLADAGGGEA
jgi:hypothetical protein